MSVAHVCEPHIIEGEHERSIKRTLPLISYWEYRRRASKSDLTESFCCARACWAHAISCKCYRRRLMRTTCSTMSASGPRRQARPRDCRGGGPQRDPRRSCPTAARAGGSRSYPHLLRACSPHVCTTMVAFHTIGRPFFTTFLLYRASSPEHQSHCTSSAPPDVLAGHAPRRHSWPQRTVLMHAA